jgi:osmotically-inducible protein OsmY
MKSSRIACRLMTVSLVLAAAAASLPACAPLAVGGVALTGAMVAVDRRSSGSQLDDQGIELRAANRLKDRMGSRARINVTSYNQRVLLTGEVMNANDKALAESTVKQVENVLLVYNELDVANSPGFAEKADDVLLTGKVKAGLVDTRELSSSAFKVVSERGAVFLMGIVSQRESDIATKVASTTKGVRKVVRLMEVITDEELARIAPRAAEAAKKP